MAGSKAPAEDHDAGPVQQGVGQLGLERTTRRGVGDRRSPALAVHEDAGDDLVGVGVAGRVGLDLDQGAQVVEPAVVGGVPPRAD